ncbi:hypothetical protein [Marinibacterium profundimaris]|uniref:Uncharacterized protein n=1 Tax=Marinibacterium profundimaris TaxID=1679460 RepID=A0A225NNL9_9RHOB|nr:hypothetical protein [Marinibacterium profundimaris]OWU76071.1 hypothetical protein ATO3_07895 [Marinibacterium profundimaris]
MKTFWKTPDTGRPAAPLWSVTAVCIALTGGLGTAARADDWSLSLGRDVWASGQTEFKGAHPGAAEPQIDLSLGFDLSENTALTFGWRELGVDDLRDEEFIEDFGSRVPYVGFALRF